MLRGLFVGETPEESSQFVNINVGNLLRYSLAIMQREVTKYSSKIENEISQN